MKNKKSIQKGQNTIEQSICVSEFIEKINKLSYKDFPVEEIIKVLQTHPISIECLEPYTFYSDARYTRNLIYKSQNQDFEIMLMCWNSKQHSAIHGHEGHKSWLKIIHGTLEITNYQEEPKTSSSLLKKINVQTGKRGLVDVLSTIHSVINNSNQVALSIHIYAPPLTQCNIYDLGTNEVKKLTFGYHSIHGKLVALEK